MYGLPEMRHLTRVWIGAEDGAHQLGPPGAGDAGKADDFARVQFEGDVVHELGPGDVLDLQQDLAGSRIPLGIDVLQVAPDHELDQVVHRHFRDLLGVDVTPVLEHRDLVGQLEDLLQAVGDVDDADALGLERAHDLEQLLQILLAQHGRWLVHDEDARLAVQGLGDLDQLLFGHRQGRNHGVDRQGDAQPVQDLPGAPL